jgi:DNA polymerase-1
MQQPRGGGVRETHIPTKPPGDKRRWVLVSCDYAAQELGTLAQVCYTLFGYSNLMDTINAGKDPHIQLGKDILAADIGRAISYDEALLAFKGKHETITKTQMKGARQTAKAGNFGFPGGMGIEKFIVSAFKGYGVRLGRPEASRLKALYLSNFPEIKEYFNWISQQGDGFTLEHPLTGMLRGDMRYTSACNSCFQHLASVITTSALYRVVLECITEGTVLHGCRPYAFIHDEIILSAPLGRCHEAAARVSTIMVEEAQRVSPDVKYSAPPAAAFRWYKAMEDVRDSEGRLVPWVPNARDKNGEWQRTDKLEVGWTWATPPEALEDWA